MMEFLLRSQPFLGTFTPLLYNVILTHILLARYYYLYFSDRETLKFKDFWCELGIFLTEPKRILHLSFLAMGSSVKTSFNCSVS